MSLKIFHVFYTITWVIDGSAGRGFDSRVDFFSINVKFVYILIRFK